MSDPEQGCGILVGCAVVVAAVVIAAGFWAMALGAVWLVARFLDSIAGALGW